MRRVIVLLLLLWGCILLPSGLFAQEGYEPITAEELRAVLEDVRSWAAETSIFRKNAVNMKPQEIYNEASAIQRKFDPVMVLMATTEPEATYKPATAMLLMGAKGVELALWHYIYAVMSDSQNAMNHGDAVLAAAVNQLHDADMLFSQLP